MGYLDQARRNKVNAEKAEALDNMQRQSRMKEMYTTGMNDGVADAYSEVEQLLAQRAAAPQQYQNPAYNTIEQERRDWEASNQDLMGQAVQEGYWQPERDPTGAMGAVDKMLWDRSGPERTAKSQAGLGTQDITPVQPGLADTLRGT